MVSSAIAAHILKTASVSSRFGISTGVYFPSFFLPQGFLYPDLFLLFCSFTYELVSDYESSDSSLGGEAAKIPAVANPVGSDPISGGATELVVAAPSPAPPAPYSGMVARLPYLRKFNMVK